MRRRPVLARGAWPEPGSAPRVLIEAQDGASAWADERILRRQGYDVRTCAGPSENPGGCPLLQGLPCPLADDADTIVMSLPLRNPNNREILAAHTAHRPDRPVCVEVNEAEAAQFTELLEGHEQLHFPWGENRLVEACRRALAGSSA